MGDAVVRQQADGSLAPSALLADSDYPRYFLSDGNHDPSLTPGVGLNFLDRWFVLADGTVITPPPDPTPVSNRDAVPIGSSNYQIPFPIPSSYEFVDVTATGGTPDGSQAKPWPRISQAVSAATDGGTIVLRGGDTQSTAYRYHEQITGPTGKKLTFQAYPGEAVYVDGSSRFTAWTNTGAGWSTPFSTVLTRTPHDVAGVPWKANNPLAGQAEQVFIGDTKLTVVADDTVPGAGQFSVHNYGSAQQTIVIGDNPTGKQVWISDLRNFWTANNVTNMLGFGVRRFASDAIEKPNGAAVFYGGTSGGSLFENMWFEDNAMAGLSISKPDVIIRNCRVQNNGQSGVTGTQCDRILVQRCVVTGNDSHHWQAGPATGGVKLTRCDSAWIDDCLVKDNNEANAVWYDWSAIHNLISNSDITSSQASAAKGAAGIQFEESDGGLVNGVQSYSYIVNTTIDGFRWSMRLMASGYVKVWNLTLKNFAESGIYVWQDRPGNPGNDGRSSAISPWISTHIQVVNVDFADSGTESQFLVYDDTSKSGLSKTGTDMIELFSGNRFAALTSGHLAEWGNAGGGRTNYQTPAALMARPDLVGKPWTNYQGTAPAGGGEPLPADVAQLIGQPTGVRHIGVF